MNHHSTTTSMIDRCDIDAYRAWTARRTSPAYMRGMPTWMWRSALGGRRPRSG